MGVEAKFVCREAGNGETVYTSLVSPAQTGHCAIALATIADVYPPAAELLADKWQWCGFASRTSPQTGIETFLILAQPIYQIAPRRRRLKDHALSEGVRAELDPSNGPQLYVFLGSTGMRKIFKNSGLSEEGTERFYFNLPWEMQSVSSDFDDGAVSPTEWDAIKELEHTLRNEAIDALGKHLQTN